MKLYCIPKYEEIKGYEELAHKYNMAFEYNDFFVPSVFMNKQKINEIISNYKALERNRSLDTLHGAFLDVTIHSDDPEIYEISKSRVYQSMDIAKELGGKAVIFHTNFIANFHSKYYQDNWVERNRVFWREVLADYPSLSIYMENMFDESPDMLQRLAIAMEDENRFGVCLDFAHAYISGTSMDEWVDKLGKYTKHIHINDNDGVSDMHMAIGKGRLPWERYTEYIAKLSKEVSVLIEVRCLQDVKDSIAYMEKNGLL